MKRRPRTLWCPRDHHARSPLEGLADAKLVSEGVLTSSGLSDWLVVTEWMPKTAEKMRAGLR